MTGGWAAPDPWLVLAIFVLAAVTDIAWVRWTITSNRKAPIQAAWWAFAIYAFGAVAVIAYVANHWYALDAGLGSALGTYAAVRHDRDRP